MQPTVSVIMGVYNAEQFLHKAITSILEQTYTDFEFLIMNDGSTDNTEKILQKFKKDDRRISILSQPNQGLAKSLNILIKEASGRYIARMDADDISPPDRLELQVEYLDNHLECAFVAGGCLIIDEDDLAIGGKILRNDPEKLKKILFSGKRNPFTHGLIMFRKKHLDELNLVYRFRYSQDFDLLLRLATRHPIGAIENVLYLYREGSSLQGNFILLNKRLSQRAFLLNLKKDLLFDDEFCISHVKKIYAAHETNDALPCNCLDFQLSHQHTVLKKLFILGQLYSLRKNTKELIAQYGFKKIFLSYYFLSFLPVTLGVFIQHTIIKMRNLKKDQTIQDMTIKEILHHSKATLLRQNDRQSP